MKKVFSYILSVVYYLVFGLMLVIFHVIQVIAHRIFGYKAHKVSVDWLNFFLLRCLNILGTRIYFENSYKFNKNVPHIIVANHQSMYDIPPLIWHMRHLHPKFISKKELGGGIPSISYNLKHGGSVLIDRKDKEQAINAIKEFGDYLSKTKRSGVIFPEGTRSRDGKLKPFRSNGLKSLLLSCPEATAVPVSIDNSWKLQKYGMFPLPIGVKIKVKVHQPIEANVHTFEQIFEYCRSKIEEEVER